MTINKMRCKMKMCNNHAFVLLENVSLKNGPLCDVFVVVVLFCSTEQIQDKKQIIGAIRKIKTNISPDWRTLDRKR